jgi:hypothetical protein
MPLQESVHFLGELRPDPLGRGDLLHGRFPQPIDRAKFPQQQILSVLTHAGTIVENALADPLLHQQLVIGIREAMRFITDSLEQSQRA